MDASLEDRCQTVIDYHKARAAGTSKMQAYTEVKGPFSVSSVRSWVNAEGNDETVQYTGSEYEKMYFCRRERSYEFQELIHLMARWGTF